MSTTPKDKHTKTLIYVLKDPDTNEIRYVGKTVNSLLNRLGQHIYEAKKLKKNTHRLNWIRSLIRIDKLPKIEKIDECVWEESQNIETYYIAYYKNLGYNLINETEGGEGTLGITVSDETRKKRKETLRKKLPKVYQYDLNGNLIKEWENVPTAAETLGIRPEGISRCLRGDRFKYKEFIWKAELVENADKDLKESIKSRHERNIIKGKGKPQSILGKIISIDSKINTSKYIYIYDNNNNFLYEAISGRDASEFVATYLNKAYSSLESRICAIINTDKMYYNQLRFSEEAPKDIIHRPKCAIIINYKNQTFNGVNEAKDFFDVDVSAIINNLKRITKTLITKEFGKVKLTWKINENFRRPLARALGLPADKIEEMACKELNIEVTDLITQGKSEL